mgnify:CR=1 FL=1
MYDFGKKKNKKLLAGIIIVVVAGSHASDNGACSVIISVFRRFAFM